MTESEERKIIHLGDITKINGAEIEPVDVITAGSPCQDLSVAGKRAGLDGERSGLFMEQIRIIKEMREHDRAGKGSDEYVRPRYMVWENVPGAFSSNKGEDFRCVLEETAKVAERDAVIPGPPKSGWSYAGSIMGDGWSIAWRVHDAQFWGVPQRRKRIALVADFGGESAPEILFERKSLSGDITESGEAGQTVAGDVEGGFGATGRAIAFEPGAASRVGGHVYEDGVCGTVRANARDNQQAVVYGICSYDSNAMKSDNPKSGIYQADTSRTLDNNGGSPACNQGGMVVVSMATKQLSQNIGDNVAMPICANDYKEPQVVCLEGNGSRPSHKGDGYAESETMYTLNSTEHHAVALENHPADSRVKISEDGTVQALTSRMGTGGNNVPMVMESEPMVAKGPGAVCQSVVRRLTPLECERLQGYPDGWTDIGDWTDSKGKRHKGESDAPRYKALGNSIALPFWFYLLRRISAQYERPATLGSLFDGIGGFPLCWERCNGKGTARWASEIEEFPIAVTKHWFG